MKKQLAVLFSGIGYHADKPLLYSNPYYIIVQSWPVHTAAK